ILVNKYNFIDDNDIIDGQTHSFHEPSHGTAILSVIGGFKRDELIGPAFGAGYLLAKTEKIWEEDTTEERFWVEAAEWADSLGTDIITSSVGYCDWYTYDDLDGRTAPITVAANIAVSRGIAVFNSAGNERTCSDPNDCFYYITPPADGFGVMAIGAVDSLGEVFAYSSSGPTRDGRIKPELAAMGVDVYAAYFTGGYSRQTGASMAAPLAAGAAALILQANPDWSPLDLREAMLQSGDRYNNPDNLYGYGLPNSFRAARLFRIEPIARVVLEVGEYLILPINISMPPWPLADIISLTLTGENLPDSSVLDDTQLFNGYAELLYWGWPEDVGTFNIRLIAEAELVDIGTLADTAEFQLRVLERSEIAVGPNPFSDSVTIFIKANAGEPADISIHAINGEKVWDNFSDTYNSEKGTVVWDGTNNRGHEVAPGVYYIIVRTLWSTEKFKVFKR
ncbi:MAG: S8 family peptidase, partial [Candidatus Zixiibacteriota bacterium]